ncbi:hypothetical protein DES32_1525 [Methylovirgula ligni]|uniref:Uncharacterized protein n=1 Tax=Methylovirgula ligni TaxID=569860 RepID=A0A3D9Z1B5_9HYPH|nr:hypothetical protein [Methylovirgula ligni]REF87888.1 hypothetical protein DES32_1525 [Methylovirgula ligni]
MAFGEGDPVARAGARIMNRDFNWADLAAFIFCGLIAVPLCDAGFHSIVEDYRRLSGYVAVVAGLIIGSFGFSFHWIKLRVSQRVRNSLETKVLRWWPAAMLLAAAFFLGPEIYRRAVPAPAPTVIKLTATTTTPLPPENLSKETIVELLSETGQIADLVEKVGLPQADRWRTRLMTQNPEQACSGVDNSGLQNELVGVRNALSYANANLGNVLKQNRIDQGTLLKIFPNSDAGGFADATGGLNTYNQAIYDVGPHPSCSTLVTSYRVLLAFVNFDRALERFSIWLAGTQGNVNRYRDALRLQLRQKS